MSLKGVFSIRRISIRRIPIIGLGLGIGLGIGLGLGLGIAFGELKFGELKRNHSIADVMGASQSFYHSMPILNIKLS